jgi:endo-1,4-beta-xylanase
MTNPFGKSRWSRRDLLKGSLAAAAAAALPDWSIAQAPYNPTVVNSLREHAQARGLLYGAAVVPQLLDIDGVIGGHSSDVYTQLVAGQCNILVAENAMKWAPLRPTPSSFNFAPADKLMRFASATGQQVRGHNLCWHESLPSWFKAIETKENAKQILIEHVQTVAGRYRGHIQSWDVVNEAIMPKDGRSDGLRKSPWLELMGPEYIEIAFQTAAVADPNAKLAYNDYDIELDTPEQAEKRTQVLMLVRRLKARNIPIHAVGIQSHLKADGPDAGAGLQTFIRELKKMDLEVYVTEMDVNTKNIASGQDAQDAAVAKVYRDYLGLVLHEPNVKMVLTWGIMNNHSWLNQMKRDWTQRPDGAPQRPLPFDDHGQPTPAFEALSAAIDHARLLTRQRPQQSSALDPSNLYKPFRVQGSPAESSYVPTPQVQ